MQGINSKAWLYSPVVDLLFVCGGFLWLVVGLQLLWTQLNPATSYYAFLGVALLGTHLFSDSHFAVTLVKLVQDRHVFTDRRLTLALHAAIGILIFGISLLVPGALPIILRVYFALVLHHYCRQTYGLVLLYCARAQCRLTSVGKMTLSLFFDCFTAMAVVRSFWTRGWIPNEMLGQTIPFWGPIPVQVFTVSVIALLLVSIVLGASLLWESLVHRMHIPLPAMLLVLSLLGLLCLDATANVIVWLYAPAFFHGSQYVVLAFSKLRGTQQRTSNLWSAFGSEYFCRLMFIAMSLYVGVPLALQQFGFSSSVAVLSVFSAVSIHHFLTDGIIWKQPRPNPQRSGIQSWRNDRALGS